MLILPFALFLQPALADQLPAGDPIPEAALVDITPQGFEAVGGLIPALVPSDIALDTMSDSSEGTWGQCWLGGYAYEFKDGWVAIQVNDVQMTPVSATPDGYLDVQMNMQIWVNDGSDPFELMVDAECISDTCDGYVSPFNAQVNTTIALSISGESGSRTLDATVGDIAVDYDLTSDNITLDNCSIGTVEDLLNLLGLSLYDLILDSFAGQLESSIADFGPQIEQTLEDAFSQASIHQESDIGGVVLTMDLEPSAVSTSNAGMRLALEGAMDADTAECIAAYDPGSSEYIAGAAPDVGTAPSGVDPNYHLGILLSDDIGNQALYALWRGGLLCYDLDEETTGFPIDTSLLGMLAGDAFDPIFPDSSPLVLFTEPRRAPTMEPAGDHDLDVMIDELGLEFYGEVDDRLARVLGVDVSTDVGIDMALDDTTGELAATVDIGGDSLDAVVASNEFVPDATEDIESNFGGVLDTLLGSILGGALGDLAFTLPAYEGMGLTTLETAPAGPQADWLGAYAQLGPVTYGADGGGCGGDSGGCGGGCASTGQHRGRLAFLAFLPLALALLRRRT